MIFKEIHIDGFGIFNGFSLKTLRNGVNIILGNNEVGKSTLLKFLRFTLFGYPRKKYQRMFPLNGGSHGGRIKTILSSGKEATFERTGDDNISLFYNKQETQNQNQWSQLLGNASSELYNNVYAFSLEELTKLSSLAESGVKDKIFSVGLGLGNISLIEVEKNIREPIEKIYIKGGRKGTREIPSILDEININRKKIQEIQNNLPYYQELGQSIKKFEQATAELDGKLEELRVEKTKLDNYLKCYDSFIAIKKAEKELQNLPELQDYPEKGIEQLEKLEDKEQEHKDNSQELQTGIKEEKGIEELEQVLKNISFNEKLLENEDKIEYLRNNLEKYKQTINDKNGDEQKIEEYEQSIKQEINNINSQWTEQNITGSTDSTLHKSKIEAFKNDLENIDNDKRDLKAELKTKQAGESPMNVNNIAIVTSIIFLIASISAFYYGIYVLSGALLLIALILFYSKKYFLKESNVIKTQQQLEELETKEQRLKEEYKNYIEQQLNLPVSLLPEETLGVFRTIKQLRKDIKEQDRLTEKLNKERLPFIREFENEADFLKEIIQNKKQDDNIEILVDQIIAEFDASKLKSQEKNKWQEELNRKKKELKHTELKLEQTQKQIKDLLIEINAKDNQDFRKRYEENEKVKERTKENNTATQTVETIVGLNKAEEVIKYLNVNEKETIEDRIRDLTKDIDFKAQEYNDKKDELGGKRNELKRIEGESELAEVLTKFETEKQKLQNAYKDWISGEIALKILTEVRAKYEKEKQPEVIKNSSNYFNKITGNRYKRIRVSQDEKDVSIYDSKEASKKIEQLSRGTKEQLLISIRLGFIEEYEKQTEPLPIIIDEAIVNFDPHRAKHTAEVLQEFGKDRQILIFTCHPETKDYFDSSTINLIQIK